MLLTYTRNGLTSNRIYQFRYRVRNKFGWGEFSEPVSIRAAQVPSIISTPSFTIVDDINVRIDWTAPYNGGDIITAYSILIQKKDGSFLAR